ncbi:hypothetical protein, partial [Xenorhabdus bovienii]|uniref:hypothetical protein n=1 Tax=Xenorhabdus bovienii TaxID=40576 RepID=UPI00056FB5E0
GSVPPAPAERPPAARQAGRRSPVAERETRHKISQSSPSRGRMAAILHHGSWRLPGEKRLRAWGKKISKGRIGVLGSRGWAKQVKTVL